MRIRTASEESEREKWRPGVSYVVPKASTVTVSLKATRMDDCTLRVVRIDRVPHNDNVTHRIIAAIRTASIVVADFTTHNQGVYYEAGFAEALGRTVIRMCRADDFHRLHFDTRQFFHIKWTDPADLRTKLAEHILATAAPRP